MCDQGEGHCMKHGSGNCGCMDSRMERFIEPCLLLLLLEKPAHGYDLISRLQDFGFGDDQDPGMVYRNLRRLELQGMISSEWDTSGAGPAKRSYEVTTEGRELLRAWAETIGLNIATLKSFLERFGRLES
ncbi:MAG: helix-turn-helix transcriptional regulator [Bacillota bacterium]